MATGRRLRGRVLRGLALAFAILLAVLVGRALLVESRQLAPGQALDLGVDEAAVAGRLGEAVRFRTLSHHDRSRMDLGAFRAFHDWLASTYPKVHASLEREVVGGASLLYTWRGSEPDRPPILLMAHQDVVPVNPGTEQEWTHGAFSGAVADGYVWGRGTLDIKIALVGIVEAVEHLLATGFAPRRTILLAFGHDEEVGGQDGNAKIAALLRERRIRPVMVLDEGLVVTEGIVPGVAAPVATVGVAEKGYVTLELVAGATEGHSSMPPRETAAGVVAQAIVRLQQDPFPARHDGAVAEMLSWLAPEVGFGNRLAFANLWLLSPAVEAVMAGKVSTDATQRTTTAPTMLEGSAQENVLPKRARAVVNFRILTGDTVDSVIARVTEVVDDPRVTIAVVGDTRQDPSPVSSTESAAFVALQQTIHTVFPEAVVAPAQVIGMTDSRYYAELADDVYRFCPTRIGPDDTSRIHGTNERIRVSNVAEVVRFYAQLMHDLGRAELGGP